MKPVKKLLSLSLVLTFLLSCALPLGALAAKPLTDIKGHWAEANINKAVERGYINGYENSTFKPNNSVTRAEFCKMINNALGLRGTTAITFLDVNSGDWFYNELSKAVAAGYITGYEDGTFRAGGYISRQEAAVVLARLVAEPESKKPLAELADGGSIASWAQSAAQSVYSKGYMTGDNTKKFNPTGNLTRAEAVKTIEGVLGKETVTSTDSSLSANQTLSNSVFTGNLSVSGTGTVTLNNCSVLGSITVSGDASVRLNNTKVARLTVNTTGGKAEITAAGSTEIRNTTLSSGATLTETSLIGSGFQTLTISGTSMTALGDLNSQKFMAGLDGLGTPDLTAANVKDLPITLSGKFDLINVNSPANINLRGGSITLMSVAAGGAGSKINLAAGTTTDKVILNGACDFTGTGIITLAQINVAGSTFETMPRTIQGNAALIPSISPKNGATDVATGSNIVLTFNEIPYTATGTVLTSPYLESSVLELHKGSENGTTVTFSTSLATNNREITIKPSTALSPSTKYFVVIKAGGMKNTQGQLNGRYVFSFTTAQGLIPETNPVDKSDTIPVGAKITLTFPEAIYQKNGDSLNSSYLRNDALSFYKNREGGDTVPFSASLSSNRKTITITPERKLDTDTTYYVVLEAGTVANSDGSLNAAQSFSFRTAENSILVPMMEPANQSKNVPTDTNIVLTFDEDLYTENGNSVDSAYLRDSVFTLNRGSSNGSTTSFTVSISDRRTVTLTPDSLQNDTTYYLNIKSSSLSNSSSSGRDYNKKTTLSFTTGEKESAGALAPTPSPKYGATGVSVSDNITLSFSNPIFESGSSKNELTSSYLRNSVIELREENSSNGEKFAFAASINSSNKTITINPDGNLRSGTRYYVVLKAGSIQNDNGVKNDRYVTYFNTTGGTLVPSSVVPSNGTTNVSTSPTIEVNFREDIYNNADYMLRDESKSYNYLKDYVFELHRGSDTSSDTVPLTVSSVTSNRNVKMTPSKSLDTNTEYFLVMVSGKLYTSGGNSNSRQVFKFKTTSTSTGLTLDSSTPSNGASSIGRNIPSITLNFSDSIYRNDTSGTSTPDQAYLRSKISVTGLNSNDILMNASGSRVTLTLPTNKALPGGYVTVSINSSAFKTSGGKTNGSLSTRFSTGNELNPSISPNANSTLAANNATISLTFYETLYKSTNASNILTGGDLPAYFKLTSSGNPDVNVTGTLNNSDGKTTIYLTCGQLVEGATYSLETIATLYDANNKSIGVKSLASPYRTNAPAGLAVTNFDIKAPDARTGKLPLVLSFEKTPYTSNGADLDITYIRDHITLKKGTSTAYIDSYLQNGTDVTLYLAASDAEPGASYTVTSSAGKFSTSSGLLSTAINKSDTAPALSYTLGVQPATGSDSKGKYTASMSANYPGKYTLTFDGRTLLSGEIADIPDNKEVVIDASSKTPNTYKVIFTFEPLNGNTPPAREASIIIASPSDDASLRSVMLTDSNNKKLSPALLGGGDGSTITPFAGFKEGEVTLTARPNDDTVRSIVFSGVGVKDDGNNSTCTVSTASGTPTIVTVAVTPADGSAPKVYKLELTP